MPEELMLASPVFNVGIVLSGVFWTIAYVLLIRQARIDKYYGMPLVALCGNISWEFIVAFIQPPPSFLGPVPIVWFLIDVVIAVQVLVYGPKLFPGLSRPMFYGMFAVTLVTAFFGMLYSNWIFMDYYDDHWAFYAGWWDAMLMAGLFLCMLYNRRSLAGQSIPIAVCMFLGNLFPAVAWLTFPPPLIADSPMQIYVLAGTGLFNVLYIAALYRARALGWGRAGPAPYPANVQVDAVTPRTTVSG